MQYQNEGRIFSPHEAVKIPTCTKEFFLTWLQKHPFNDSEKIIDKASSAPPSQMRIRSLLSPKGDSE